MHLRCNPFRCVVEYMHFPCFPLLGILLWYVGMFYGQFPRSVTHFWCTNSWIVLRLHLLCGWNQYKRNGNTLYIYKFGISISMCKSICILQIYTRAISMPYSSINIININLKKSVYVAWHFVQSVQRGINQLARKYMWTHVSLSLCQSIICSASLRLQGNEGAKSL